MDVLLVTTIGHALSALVVTLAGVLVLTQNPRATLNRAFFITTLATGYWGFTFAAGINLPPSATAYLVWFSHLIIILIVSSYLHFTYAAVRKEHEARWVIRGVYAIGALIFLGALLAPHLFIPEISPKLFTESYTTAGPLFLVMFIYFAAVFFMAFLTLVYSYLTERDNRKQVEYFLVATIIGFGIAPIDFFLVFDVPVSPFYGMFFGLYILPIAYGILTDQLLDIRIVVKRAFVYSLIISVIAGGLTLLTFLSDSLVANVAWIQFWTIPIFTAFIAFIIGRLFWLKSVESDRIKYEFVNVVTHKLRTPLTQINWRVRELLDTNNDPKVRDVAKNIQRSTSRLIELTNIIFETTQEDTLASLYNKEKVGLVGITRSVFKQFESLIKEKKIVTSIHVDDEVYAFVDKRRITAVIEVLIENAIHYTPKGGFVQVIVYEDRGRINYSVRDSGIGVSPEDRKRIFTRFYRSDAAKRIDTEGIGLGLAMAKSIIEKHGGRIGVESQGEGKGSIFWFLVDKA